MWKQKHKLVLLIFSAHLNKLSHLWLGVCMHHVILAWIYNPNMKALFPSSIAMMILRSDLLRTFITVSVMARPLAKLSLLSMGLSIALIFWWEWGQLWVCTILFLIRNRYSAWIWSIFKLLKQIKLQHFFSFLPIDQVISFNPPMDQVISFKFQMPPVIRKTRNFILQAVNCGS